MKDQLRLPAGIAFIPSAGQEAVGFFIPSAGQEAIGFLCHKGTLWAYGQLSVHQNPQDVFSPASF